MSQISGSEGIQQGDVDTACVTSLLDEALRRAAVGAVLGLIAGLTAGMLLGDPRPIHVGLVGAVVGFMTGLLEPYLEDLLGLR